MIIPEAWKSTPTGAHGAATQDTIDYQHDIALIELKTSIGTHAGGRDDRKRYVATVGDEIRNIPMQQTGYPADKGGDTMWSGVGRITGYWNGIRDEKAKKLVLRASMDS